MNELLISDAHSSAKQRASLPVKMMGGNPSIGFIWIDDVCHTITKTPSGKVSIKKTK